MTPHPSADSPAVPVFEPAVEARYSLEVIAELAGVPAQTVLHCQQQGLLGDPDLLDDESLRRLRRLGHLCALCGVNEAGVKILAGLLDELELLREALRRG